MCISVSSTMMSRLILNLKESLDARVVNGSGYEYNTIDVTISEIISRQLGDLEMHDMSHTVDPSIQLLK
jgi:hypothetical protein